MTSHTPLREDFFIDLFIDNTVVTPMLAMNRRDGEYQRGSPATRVQGAAARLGARHKHRRYPAQDLPPNKTLVPAVAEVFGHLGEEFVRLLAHFAAVASAVRNWPKWFFWHKFAPKFAACLAEGNHLKANFMRDFYANRRVDVGADDVAGADPAEPALDLEGPALSARRRGHVRVPVARPAGYRAPRRQVAAGVNAHGGGRRAAGGGRRARNGGSAARPASPPRQRANAD